MQRLFPTTLVASGRRLPRAVGSGCRCVFLKSRSLVRNSLLFRRTDAFNNQHRRCSSLLVGVRGTFLCFQLRLFRLFSLIVRFINWRLYNYQECPLFLTQLLFGLDRRVVHGPMLQHVTFSKAR